MLGSIPSILNQHINMNSSAAKRPVPKRPEALIDAAAATKLLGVSRNTLYAYVSRGLVRSTEHPTVAKASLYVAADVQALVARKTKMRRPRTAAATALDFGLPVLKTRLTHFEDDRLYYRSEDAIAFSRKATLEEAAQLLWQTGDTDPFAGVAFDPAKVPGWTEIAARYAPARATDRASTLLPLLTALEVPNAGRAGAHAFGAAARLVLAIAAAVAPVKGAVASPIHRVVAQAWGKPKSSEAIRRALVLLADHELNASTFAVRVVASTGARHTHCVLAGIAALSGPLHGAATERTRAFLSGIERPADAAEAVATRLQHGELLPGFGHFLYREGDPRAAELLEQIKLDPVASAALQAGRSMGGVEPNVDFALVALERSFELPPGAALALFAIGRSVGWLAHVFEQRASGRLIRPRAEFVME
jgi:citrate synthase